MKKLQTTQVTFDNAQLTVILQLAQALEENPLLAQHAQARLAEISYICDVALDSRVEDNLEDSDGPVSERKKPAISKQQRRGGLNQSRQANRV
jgi:hypothetical protein